MSVFALGGFAASLWVALVYALGRDLSAHERLLLAGGGVAFFVLLPAVAYALEGIAAHWRRTAAHRRTHAPHRGKHGW